jgi:hypothetical protein
MFIDCGSERSGVDEAQLVGLIDRRLERSKVRLLARSMSVPAGDVTGIPSRRVKSLNPLKRRR